MKNLWWTIHQYITTILCYGLCHSYRLQRKLIYTTIFCFCVADIYCHCHNAFWDRLPHSSQKKQYNIAAYLLRQNFAYGALKHYLGKMHTRFWDRPCAHCVHVWERLSMSTFKCVWVCVCGCQAPLLCPIKVNHYMTANSQHLNLEKAHWTW